MFGEPIRFVNFVDGVKSCQRSAGSVTLSLKPEELANSRTYLPNPIWLARLDEKSMICLSKRCLHVNW